MATSYSLKLVNQTTQGFYFVVWASLPASGSSKYVSSAWQVKYLNPDANVTFSWQTTWQAVQTDVVTQSGGGAPVKITSVVAANAVLADGDVFPLLFEGNKGFKFMKPTKDSNKKGHIVIDNVDKQATLGLGNNGAAIAVTEAPVLAGLSLDMDVNPSYWLGLTQKAVIDTDIVKADTFTTKEHPIVYVLGNTNFTAIAKVDAMGKVYFDDSQNLLTDEQLNSHHHTEKHGHHAHKAVESQ